MRSRPSDCRDRHLRAPDQHPIVWSESNSVEARLDLDGRNRRRFRPGRTLCQYPEAAAVGARDGRVYSGCRRDPEAMADIDTFANFALNVWADELSNFAMKISSVCYGCLIASLTVAVAQQPTPAVSSTPSQHRGRLLVPPGTPTASPSAAPSTSPKPIKEPMPTEEPTLIPVPAPTLSGQSQEPISRGKFKSQAKKFNPRKVEPMPSASASATPTGSPAARATKQEKKEQKQAPQKPVKTERKPSPSPQSSVSGRETR
jgi:hypothetical protein